MRAVLAAPDGALWTQAILGEYRAVRDGRVLSKNFLGPYQLDIVCWTGFLYRIWR